MTPVGLVEAVPQPIPTQVAPRAELQLHVEDVLATPQRLWVRGRLLDPDRPSPTLRDTNWWEGWWVKPEAAVPPVTAQLQIHVSGHIFETTVPLTADGHFEALLDQPLPAARRGWRVARYQVTLAGGSARACGVVLTPPAEAAQAVVVLLPEALTYEADAFRRLARSEQIGQLTALFQRLQQTQGGARAIYYVAAVPSEAKDRQAQLALGATALGWPSGQFVLMPAEPVLCSAALTRGLDRLRWLLAGSLDLIVLNQEPAVGSALHQQLEPAADRAAIGHLVQGK
jgi:hypothetical protein